MYVRMSVCTYNNKNSRLRQVHGMSESTTYRRFPFSSSFIILIIILLPLITFFCTFMHLLSNISAFRSCALTSSSLPDDRPRHLFRISRKVQNLLSTFSHKILNQDLNIKNYSKYIIESC